MKVAKDMGADFVVHVDSRDAKVMAKKVEASLGCMPDITIECSGAEPSIQTGIYVRYLGNHGDRVKYTDPGKVKL